MPLHRPLLTVLLVVSCRGPEEPPRAMAPAAPPSTPATAAGPAAHDAPSLPEAVTLEPLPDKGSVDGAHVVLGAPSESRLSREAALGLPVGVSVSGVPAGVPVRVQVALDQGPASPVVVGEPILLKALLPADQELEDGAHRLVAALTHPDGDPVRGASGVVGASASLVVGATGAEPPGPQIVVLEPHGTYNGPSAAASAMLSYYVVGAPADASIQAEVTTTGKRTERLLSSSRSYAIGRLESGDYRFALRLAGGQETVRTITVNLDAPVAN